MSMHPTLRRVVTPPLLFLAFLVVVFEETFWRWAKWLGAQVARLPLFGPLERLIASLEPRWVVGLFLIPIALLFPVKLGALWLIANGHPFLGIMVIIAAKSLGTAFSARLFTIAEPKLMQVPLFARLRGWANRLLARAHAFLDASPSWQAFRGFVYRIKLRAKLAMARLRVRGALGLRYAAARRRLRRS